MILTNLVRLSRNHTVLSFGNWFIELNTNPLGLSMLLYMKFISCLMLYNIPCLSTPLVISGHLWGLTTYLSAEYCRGHADSHFSLL